MNYHWTRHSFASHNNRPSESTVKLQDKVYDSNLIRLFLYYYLTLQRKTWYCLINLTGKLEQIK